MWGSIDHKPASVRFCVSRDILCLSSECLCALVVCRRAKSSESTMLAASSL